MAVEDVTYRVKLRESIKVQQTLNFEAFSRLSLPNIFIIPTPFSSNNHYNLRRYYFAKYCVSKNKIQIFLTN